MPRQIAVFAEPSEGQPIRFSSNTGAKIGIEFLQDGKSFNFAGWTGRCAITDLKGAALSPPINPTVELNNDDPLISVIYLTITREQANQLKGKEGFLYDVCIDSGSLSYRSIYGSVKVDIGSSAIP